MYMDKTIRERILDNIEIITESGCWVWMGGLSTHGYGHPTIKNKKMGAHRLSYAEFVEEIPKGLFVLHRCDIPCCVNPAHLFLGTHQDNMDDRGRKGRSAGGGSKGERKGEGNPRAKITEKDVIYIRASDKPAKVLAIEYGISAGTVSGIKARRSWRHVK